MQSANYSCCHRKTWQKWILLFALDLGGGNPGPEEQELHMEGVRRVCVGGNRPSTQGLLAGNLQKGLS
jgi:hypothetical protein